MITAAAILTAARDRHPGFDPQRTPDPVLLRALNSYQRALLAKAVQRNRRALVTVLHVPLPLDVFADGITLPANIYAGGDGTATDINGNAIPFSVVDPSIRYGVLPWPSGYLDGLTTLRLVGTENDWLNIASLDIPYVAAAVDLTKLSDPLGLPDEASPACVEYLAAFLTRRGCADANLPPMTAQMQVMAAQSAAGAEDDFLNALGARRVGQVFQVQDGF